MNLKTKYAHSLNYGTGRSKSIKYIVIHYTGNNGDTDESNGKYFNFPRGVSAHYFVDEDSVTQTVKDTDTAWHCGANKYCHSDCRNNNAIGVEMCSEKDKNGVYFFNEATIKNTVEIVRLLMKKYNIPIDRVIRHYDVTGKKCPEPFVRLPDSWERFKQRLCQ